jgi:cell division protein FtsB
MAVVNEIRRRARHILPQVIAACLVGYFAYHAVQGDGGILAYMRVQAELEKAEAIRAELADQRQDLEQRVQLLQNNIDRDLLSERARAVLNFARPDELLVIVPAGQPAVGSRPTPGVE